jgi:DNA-binding response OmpR family regulator
MDSLARLTECDPTPPLTAPAEGNADGIALRVAIVEDDRIQAEQLSQWLERAGHHGYYFARGGSLINALREDTFDALVLNWNPPDINGVEVLRYVRGAGRSSLPIVFVSARGREEDVVSALRQGADDYMVRPVRYLEFIARVEAIARRGNHYIDRPRVLEVDEYQIDCQTRTVMRLGRPVNLTTKDFDLFVEFLHNVGRLLSRGYLCRRVWGRSAVVTSRTLDTHVSHVRRKLELTPENGWCLAAVYRHGYRLHQLGAASRTGDRPAIALPMTRSRNSMGNEALACRTSGS